MAIEKTAVKLATLKEVGAMFEDNYEVAKLEKAKVEGLVPVLDGVGKLIEALCKEVDRDLDDNKVPVSEPLQVAKYVKEYILKAKKLTDDAALRAVHARFDHQGRITALDIAVKQIKKLHDAQVTKLRAFEKVLDGEVDNVVPMMRSEGQHPGSSLKDRRLAEQANEERAEKAKTEKMSKSQKRRVAVQKKPKTSSSKPRTRKKSVKDGKN
jgi:hypothetical protein